MVNSMAIATNEARRDDRRLSNPLFWRNDFAELTLIVAANARDGKLAIKINGMENNRANRFPGLLCATCPNFMFCIERFRMLLVCTCKDLGNSSVLLVRA
jgi:hypothetical protein